MLTRWLIVAAALAAILAVYRFWLHVNPTTVALTLLLLILSLAARWGLTYAVVASLAATLCYNFFFLPPVGKWTIEDPQNWIAIAAFLSTSVIASRLSARIREEALEARRREHEVEVLFQLSRELLQTDNVFRIAGQGSGAARIGIDRADAGLLQCPDGSVGMLRRVVDLGL